MKKTRLTVNIPGKTLAVDGKPMRLEDTFTDAYVDHADSDEPVLNLEYKGRFSGWIKTSFATIRITRYSMVKGTLLVQKSNLAIKAWSIEVKGITLLMNGNIPLPVPIPVQFGINVDLSPAFCIMPFPLYDGKYGNLSDSWHNHSGFINLMFGLLFDFQLEWDVHVYNFLVVYLIKH